MRFFEPNEKRTTVSVYIFLVGLFSVFCVIVGINIHLVPKILSFILNVVRPVIYGFIIAFTIRPLVKFTEEKLLFKRKERRLGFKRVLSVIIVYATVIFLVVLFCITVIPEIIENYDTLKLQFVDFVDVFQGKTAEILNKLPGADSSYAYYDILPDLRKNPSDTLFSDTLRNIESLGISSKSEARTEVAAIFDRVSKTFTDWITSSVPGIFSSALTIITGAKNLILGIILSIYFLMGEEYLLKHISRFSRVWLPKKIYSRLLWIIRTGKNVFRDYIVVRALDALSIGLLSFICLSIFRTPYALFLSVIWGFTSFFPFIGPIIGILLGSLIIMIVNFKYLIIYLAVTLAINIFDSRYLEPFLNAGHQQHPLPAIWVFTAIVVMGGFLGIIGVLIGIPIFAFIYSIIKEIAENHLKERGFSGNTLDWFSMQIDAIPESATLKHKTGLQSNANDVPAENQVSVSDTIVKEKNTIKDNAAKKQGDLKDSLAENQNAAKEISAEKQNGTEDTLAKKRRKSGAKDTDTEKQRKDGAKNADAEKQRKEDARNALAEKQRKEDEEVQNNIKDYFTEKRKDDDEEYLKMKDSLNKAYSSAKGFFSRFRKKK